MEASLLPVMEAGFAAFSVFAMGAFGLKLLLRLFRLLRGEESAAGLCGTREKAPLGDLLFCALAALLSRLLLYVFVYALHRLGGGTGGFLESLRPLWTHWDTRHYLNIARIGYVNTGDDRLQIVFFPLYPLLMRLLSPLTGGDLFSAGILISLFCAALASALLYALCFPYGGRGFAVLCVAYFLLSPSSVFLGCCYTEALFLCLTLGCVVLLRAGHPWLAALCGMAGAFTRMPGVIVSGLFLIALLEKIPRGEANARTVAKCLAQMTVVFGGLFLYWAVNWRVTGDPFIYLTYQRENWFQRPGTFWGSTANTVQYFFETMGDGDWLFSWGYQLFAMVAVYALLALRGDNLPFDLAAYAFVYTCVVLSPTWLLSAPRYLFALAPLPMLRARLSRRRGDHALMLAISAAGLLLWAYGFAIAGDVL